MIIPTDINQTFNATYHFTNDTEQFFTEVVGMTPSNFCMKFANWADSQNGEYCTIRIKVNTYMFLQGRAKMG
jgi:hypothetical protein